MNSTEYQVTIKSANQKVDDYVTKCQSDWTVERLKRHISETHVNKPNIGDQRLIYAGVLLKDSLTLKQIFFRDSLCTELTNSSKTDFTIHLVCSTNSQKNAPTTQQTTGYSQASSQVGTVQYPRNLSSLPFTSHRYNHPHASNSSSIPNVSAATNRADDPTASPLSNGLLPDTFDSAQAAEIARTLMQSEQMRQQLATFQQLAQIVALQIAENLTYTSNISSDNINSQISNLTLLSDQTLNLQATNLTSTSYLATPLASTLFYAGNRQPTQLVSPDTQHASAAGQNEDINNDNNQNAPMVGDPAEAQFGFGADVQAEAPVVDQPAQPQMPNPELPAVQHDVIDWVYYSIRAVILMAALYIHASMFRLLFLVGLLAIAYFFNRRRVTAGNQEPQPPAPHQEPPQDLGAPPEAGGLRRRNIANVDDDGQQRIEENSGNSESGNHLDQTVTREEIANRRVPFLKLCYLVVTDFLASLVPE